MGYVYIYDVDSPDDHYILPTESDVLSSGLDMNTFRTFFSGLTLSTDGNNDSVRVCGL